MKEVYEELELEIIAFGAEDVIATSNGENGDPNEGGKMPL